MADANELAFIKNHINTLGSLPVQFTDDYQQPPSNSLRKIPIIPVDLPPPPPPKQLQPEASSSDIIELVFKVTKPAFSFTLLVSPTDTIASIKKQLSSQPGAPPADSQRLLLRGKALADSKLLREYPVKGGDTVNLMLKPGFEFDWTATTKSKESSNKTLAADVDTDVQMALNPESSKNRHGHSRVPSLVLSPSPSPSTISLPGENLPSPIPLTLDTSNMPSMRDTTILSSYQKGIADPEFWSRLLKHLQGEFSSPNDAEQAFETFLVGSKGQLSSSDIAKIRDKIGIIGMNGS